MLTMGRAPYYPWTAEQIATLRASYPATRTTDLAASMGIPVDYIYRKAQGLGLRKSAEFVSMDAKGRPFRGGVLAQATQFQRGQKPWNAGKSYQAGGRSVQTQFKPGERRGAAAHNWVPVGSYRIAARDHYLQRKTSDQHSGPRDWTSVHRLVWEAAHGPVPAEHVVVFLPGRKSTVLEDITIDAVECITRADLMRRNTIWAHGPEIGGLIQLKGAINRQVRRLAQGAQA